MSRIISEVMTDIEEATFLMSVRRRVPAVVHEDGTGRLQSVTAERNPRYHALISAFHALTGVPVILNTSFNIMGKPILHTSEDAILMFYTSGLDALVVDEVVGRYYTAKKPGEYRVLDENFGTEDYGVGTRKDDTANAIIMKAREHWFADEAAPAAEAAKA